MMSNSSSNATIPKICNLSVMLYATAVFTIIITIIGIIGNLLTIIALYKHPRVRKHTTSAFIMSLSIADFLFCSINLPFSASRFIHHTWIHGDSLCIVFPFLRYVNVGLSLLSIAAITVNRYVFIVHPSWYDRIYQKKYIFSMVLSLWVFSISLMLPTLFGKWGRFGFDEKIMNCSILEVKGKSPKTFLFIFGFLLPCIVIVFCYIRIFWVIVRSKTRVRKHSTSDSNEQVKKDPKKQQDWKITKMVLIIFSSFLICYLPITIIKVADKRVKYPALHIVSYIFLYMSACINPLIYGVTNKHYRKAYKSILIWMKDGVLSVGTKISSYTSQDSSTQMGTVMHTLNSKSGINSDDLVNKNNEKNAKA
ncbi:G-protein coupled receptor moody-like [Centruroides vittatus]|uniref:G-protein coupled receptor moody-like n=1 Tax=Centruroides vittatus TaxID=120091 RepID=UPI00350EF56A